MALFTAPIMFGVTVGATLAVARNSSPGQDQGADGTSPCIHKGLGCGLAGGPCGKYNAFKSYKFLSFEINALLQTIPIKKNAENVGNGDKTNITHKNNWA